MKNHQSWHREGFPFASTRSSSHGPHDPCPKSPTGNHCFHTVSPGIKRCCYCGKTTSEYWASKPLEKHITQKIHEKTLETKPPAYTAP